MDHLRKERGGMRERAFHPEGAVWCRDTGPGQGEQRHGVFSKNKKNRGAG